MHSSILVQKFQALAKIHWNDRRRAIDQNASQALSLQYLPMN
jgi:hypothetical protein